MDFNNVNNIFFGKRCQQNEDLITNLGLGSHAYASAVPGGTVTGRMKLYIHSNIMKQAVLQPGILTILILLPKQIDFDAILLPTPI